MTKTPLRVSFFGGGTDIKEYYKEHYGAVLSTTINKYVFVTVKQHGVIFDEPVRLNYSKTEMVATIDEIENAIAREALRATNVGPPIYVSTVADIPSGSGLGSSSTFAVGLLNALHAMRQQRINPGELAQSACELEIDRLQKPIGKQDQYASAFGGLNLMRFNPGGDVSLTPIRINKDQIDTLFGSLMLFWTGITRDADEVLVEQRANIASSREQLDIVRGLAEIAAKELNNGSMTPARFGELLHEGWTIKRGFASKISNSQIDSLYERARDNGAYGGKLCGAGNGGFLLLCVPPEARSSVRAALSDVQQLPFKYEPLGTRILFPTPYEME